MRKGSLSRDYRGSQKVTLTRSRYGKHTNEVCELFDVEVLWDSIDEGPFDAEGNPSSYKRVCFLGQPSELAAGLRGHDMTKLFDSEQKLNAWCRRHIVHLRKIAKEQLESGVYGELDCTEWK